MSSIVFAQLMDAEDGSLIIQETVSQTAVLETVQLMYS